MQEIDVTANVGEAAVETVVNVAAKRGRNFSFKHKKPETLDEIEVNGQVFKIPAAVGSTYWAVLKVCYEKHGSPIYAEELVKAVSELLEEYDEEQWAKYINKEKTTAHRMVEGTATRTVQKIKPWQERIVNNAKTLCRTGGNSAYGLRLIELGHCLKFYQSGRPYFILKTSVESGDDNGVSGT